MSTNNSGGNGGGNTNNNGFKNKMYNILEMMGIERNPKTMRGKVLKGFQLITIPLFIFILASKPYVEEKHLSNKIHNERKLEAMEMQRAKERSEKFDKEHPEIAQELENYKNYLKTQNDDKK